MRSVPDLKIHKAKLTTVQCIHVARTFTKLTDSRITIPAQHFCWLIHSVSYKLAHPHPQQKHHQPAIQLPQLLTFTNGYKGSLSAGISFYSASQLLLYQPVTKKRINFQSKAFSITAAAVWNSLSSVTKSSATITTFNAHLKTELFSAACDTV